MMLAKALRFSLLVAALAMAFAIGVHAWTDPAQPPPAGNVPPPGGGGSSQTPWTSNIDAAGFTLQGNSTASGNLTLDSTSDVTKGFVLLNPTGGRVGVLTATPGAYALDVSGNANATQLCIAGVCQASWPAGGSQTPWTSNINAAGFTLQGNNIVSGNLRLDSTSSATKGFVLLNPTGGRVGVLTATPGAYALDVSGNANATQLCIAGVCQSSWPAGSSQTPWTSNINAAGFTLQGNSTASGNLTLDSTSSATKGFVLLNPTGGRVGVLTATPGAYALDVSGNANATQLCIAGVCQSSWPAGGSQTPWTSNINAAGFTLQGNSTASGDLTLDSTSSATKGDVLLNPSGGRVSIGTATPGARLHVRATDNAVGAPGLYGSYHLLLWNPVNANGQGPGIAFANTMTADNVGGAIIFNRTGTFSQGELQFYTKQSTATGVAPVQAMVIDNAGNVGIGTTSPGQRLEIASPVGVANPRIRLKRTVGSAGSVDLFIAVGNATARTGTALCENVTLGANSAAALCLGHWSSALAESTCGTSLATSRALCAIVGD